MEIEEKIAAIQAESDAYKDVPIPEDAPGVRFNRTRSIDSSPMPTASGGWPSATPGNRVE